MDTLQIVTILVALVIAGEAAALAIGMHIVKKSQSPWISLKNDLMLAFDAVVGLVLILITFNREPLISPIWAPLFVTIGLLTHIYRIWEYLAGRENAFCANRSLFIFNNLKILGLLVILIWGLII